MGDGVAYIVGLISGTFLGFSAGLWVAWSFLNGI